MHIAQQPFPNAGQTDRELQIPTADFEEATGQLGAPFDTVFGAQEELLNLSVTLPSKVMGGTTSAPAGSTPVAESRVDTERDLMAEPFTVDPYESKLAGNMQDEFLEVISPTEKAVNTSVQDGSRAVETLKSPVRDVSEAEFATYEPVLIHQGELTDAPPAQPDQTAKTPSPADVGSWKLAEAPSVEARITKAELSAAPASPQEQIPNATALKQASSETALDFVDRPHSVSSPNPILPDKESGIPTHDLAARDPRIERAPNPISALAEPLDDKSVVDMPKKGIEMQAETRLHSQNDRAVSTKIIGPQVARVDSFIPAGGTVETVQGVSKHIDSSGPRAPATLSAPEPVLITRPAPAMPEMASFPLSSVSVLQVTEHDRDHRLFEDVAFRVVEQVSSSTSDLKSNLPARGADVPRFVSTQIAEIVRQQPDRPVELTLSPEELGRLRISFQTEGSAMHVTLSFERPDTLDLMRRHIDQLAHEMRAFGMSEVNFTFQQQTSDGGRGAFPDGESARSSDEPPSDPRGAPDDVAPLVLNVAGRAGVDIRV
ncbi:flagellar hook-length control protein FliK [Aliiroseovarius sp. S253]|uniref:flagellar hook-length control protein FliK n=1 Tax=Aliiroseovarius sp. S253 TaxID=3415133 RepID=UPI003C7CF0EE